MSRGEQVARVRQLLSGRARDRDEKGFCPKCGGPSGGRPVRVQVWKERFFRLDFTDQRWKVDQETAPAFCGPCASALGKRRTFASFVAIAPILLLLAFTPPSKNNLFSFLVFFFYSFYLVKWGSYTWADILIYGEELREQLKQWIPKTEGKVRFPVPASQCALRLALFSAGGFLVLMARELLRQRAAT